MNFMDILKPPKVEVDPKDVVKTDNGMLTDWSDRRRLGRSAASRVRNAGKPCAVNGCRAARHKSVTGRSNTTLCNVHYKQMLNDVRKKAKEKKE